MLEMQLSGKGRWGRPKRRYLDVMKEDVQEIGAREEKVFDRSFFENPLGDPY